MSSPNTPEAPNKARANARIVLITPVAGLLAAVTISCTAVATDDPTAVLSCAWILPEAASAPQTSPAIEMAASSSGAREKTV